MAWAQQGFRLGFSHSSSQENDEVRPRSCPLGEILMQEELGDPMVPRIIKWVFITTLVLEVTWPPSANYQIPLGLVFCAAAIMLVPGLFFVKDRFEIHYNIINKPDLGASRSL
jgi:hypothetical protein